MSMSRVVCDVLLNGSMQPKSFTVVDGAESQFLHGTGMYGNTTKYPGGPAGRPFYVWQSTPAGTIVSVDYASAAVCGASPGSTQSAANAFKANPTVAPEDVLTYA